MYFERVAAVFLITMAKRICTFLATFLRILYLFDSIFSEIVWIDKLHCFMKEFFCVTMVAIEIGKRQLSVIIAMVAARKKSFVKNLNLIDSNYYCKNWLIGSLQDEIKYHNLKNVNFQKKGAKDKNITILLFMTTFHNFALRIETG